MARANPPPRDPQRDSEAAEGGTSDPMPYRHHRQMKKVVGKAPRKTSRKHTR